VGGRFRKVTFASDPASKLQHGGKTDLLIEKRKLSDFGWIFSLPTAENRANDRPRSIGAFVPISDSGALLNREKLSLFLSLGGATL